MTQLTKQQEKLFYIEILTCMMEQGYKWRACSMISEATRFRDGIKLVRLIAKIRTQRR